MRIKIQNENGVLTIYLYDELDEDNAKEMAKCLDRAMSKKDYHSVILDFEEVPFLDSTAVGVLFSRYKRLSSMGVSMYVKNVNKQINKVFETIGLYEIIKCVR